MRGTYYIKNDLGQIAVMAFMSQGHNIDQKERWILNRIAVARGTNKGEGWGTRLLTEICRDADREHVVLWLGVSPDQSSRFRDLIRWYTRHGFEPQGRKVTRTYNVMVRQPQ